MSSEGEGKETTVGIIGGTGQMGSFFAGVFRRAGWKVAARGRKSDQPLDRFLDPCDIVMIVVPIRATIGVIEEVAPLLRADQLLCDLTSLKTGPVRAMVRSKAGVVGLHPMFGPGVETLQGQTIVVTPATAPEERYGPMVRVFTADGARITVTTPEHHDRMMAIVQGLTHFMTLCMADTMRRQRIEIEEVLTYTSPIYRIQLGLIGRLLSQDAGLYGDMLQMNPAVGPVLADCEEAVQSLRASVQSGDPDRFSRFFLENAEKYSIYGPQATAETDHLIQCLVAR
ncbi:prephenate dehydrogenase/arogenate dehydrogenase family protein [Methanosphaerula subterraneus]|uniref:prephenate dehydrogenase/arogenate dehydrogenase family protein n=1 Tax=Methanosphaerula subterraneus TaxID=3350244 RepID=UPI003F83DD9D